MALSIPECVTTINSLPAEAKQKVLDQIAAQFGPLEAPPKPEPTPEDLKAIEDARKLNEEKAKATAENERRRSEQASKDVIGSLNTLGSDDLKIALSAIGANCGVAKTSNIPAGETKADLETLPTTELRSRAEARGITGNESMSDKELIAAILKVDAGTRPGLDELEAEDDLAKLSKAELLDRARALNIPGASSMNKDELIGAIEDAQE